MKRQRGRGRKPGNQNNNRSFESNGPDVKIRGNAAHVHEKYLQLARDASSSGDRILAENYHQHAEHYFRIVQASQPKRDDNDQGGRNDGRGQDNRNQDNRGQDGRGQDNRNADNRDGGRSADRGQDGRQQSSDQNQDAQNRDAQSRDGNEDDGRSRRGRGRRPRRDDSDQGGRNGADKDRDPLEVVNLDGEDGAQGDARTTVSEDQTEAPKRRSRSPRKPKADLDAQAALDAAGDKGGEGGGSKQDDAA